MSQEKTNISTSLQDMGFAENYVNRAFKVYEKNYGTQYNVEVITEIIVRLQNKDKKKKAAKAAGGSAKKSPSKQHNNSSNSSSQSPSKQHNSASNNSPHKPKTNYQNNPSPNKHNQQVNINANNNSGLPPKGGMNRSRSGGDSKPKKKAPQKKLPPVHNNTVSFQVHDHVLYYHNNTQVEAEVMRIIEPSSKIEITFPTSKYIMMRAKEIVHPSQLQPMNRQSNSQSPNRSSNSQSPNRVKPQPPASMHGSNNMGSKNNNVNNTVNINMNKIKKKKTSSKPKSPTKTNGSSPTFESHMTHLEADKLRVHDKIDHRDQVGRFVFATIHEKTGTNLKIHYDGWSRKWDAWSDYQKELHRFAKSGSISKRLSHRFRHLKKGDYVDINPTQRHPGWKCGEIRRLDQKSGQVQVVYESADKNYLYWAHLDNKGEIAEFTKMSGTNHTLQKNVENQIISHSPNKTQSQQPTNVNNVNNATTQQQQQQNNMNMANNNNNNMNNVGQYNNMQYMQNMMNSANVSSADMQQYNNNMQNMSNNMQQQQMMQQQMLHQQQMMQQQNQYNNNQQQMMTMQQHQQQKQQQQQQQQQPVSPMDEMETFKRIRAKRFPRYPNEEIANPYGIGDWLEVQDSQTKQWITATVIDKENNWIVVHFDGWPSKYDQKIHAVKNTKRLRGLGAGLAETQEEKEIKEEMDNFLREVELLNWKLIEVDGDGNCLYRCFATQIYGDTSKHMKVRDECCSYMRNNMKFFQNFIPDFEDRMKQKEQEYEWGDHVDITALSELFNVRVRVFEYNKIDKKLYMSFDQGEHQETLNLPLILLARHRKKHYNIIEDPGATFKRPLQNAVNRAKIRANSGDETIAVSLKALRLKQDADELADGGDHKDDEKDEDDNPNAPDVNMNDKQNNNPDDGYHISVSMVKGDSNAPNTILNRHHSSSNAPRYGLKGSIDTKEFDLSLDSSEFFDVIEVWNLSEPLNDTDLKNIFQPLLKKLYKKLEFQWNLKCSQIGGGIDKKILNRFWQQQFEKNMNYQCKKWIDALKEKIPTQQYKIQTSLNTFNQIICNSVSDNLGHIISNNRRQSTINIDSNNMYKQQMDIDQ